MAYGPPDIWQRNIPKRPVPRPPAPPPYQGPPAPPDRRTIDMLFPDYPERSEIEWEQLLDARVKPFVDAIDKTTLGNRAQSEFIFERSAAANQGLSTAFLQMLTGGKTGTEAEQFAKEQFGGQYLPAQAMSMAADRLRELTNEWDDRDWQISSQYMEAMEKVPGFREQLRQDIQAEEGDQYEREFKYATLLLDEAWNVYNANAKAYGEAESRRIAEAAIRREQGMEGYEKRKDAVSEAARMADDTGTIWGVKKNKAGEWIPYDTKKKKPVKPGQKPSDTADRNSALREASDMTKNDTFVWRVKKVNGVWTAYRTNQKKAAPAKDPKEQKLTPQQQAESDLALKVQTDFAGDIVGKEVANPAAGIDTGAPPFIKQGGKSYDEAFDWLYRIAKSQFIGRSDDYIREWVRIQLRTYFPQGATDARGGR